MAEILFRDLAKKRGAEGMFYVYSSGTSDEEHGNPIYPPARRCLQQHGVPFDPYRTARKVTAADYDCFDRIICMDASNLRIIKKIIPEDPQKKIHLMMAYTGQGRDVADPWYTGDFEETFQDLLEGCEAMLKVGIK